MIIFFADGRLGNQLFQYSFLESVRNPGELMITAGMELIQKYFRVMPFFNIRKDNRWSRFFAYEILNRIMYWLAKVRIITSITVDTEKVQGVERERATYTIKPGLIEGVKYVGLGYFQSEIFFDSQKISHIKLKETYLKQAQKYLSSIKLKGIPVFVHYRRGDYKNFEISGEKTDIPISYYHRAISKMSRHYAKAYYIILSDDRGEAKSIFANLERCVFSPYDDPGVDFAIMTLCQGGILSPSSFSWWGSYMMENRGYVIAPRYWLGYNVGVEYHQGTVPKYAQVISPLIHKS